MATPAQDTKAAESETADARRSQGKVATPRTPIGQVLRELRWPLLLLVGIASGLLWVILLLQGGALGFFAGLLPVTGGILVGRRAKQHVTWHAILLSLITAVSAAAATALVLATVQNLDPILRQTLGTSFILLIPFPAFGVITAARSEQRARAVREVQANRGGKLEKPGRVKTLDDLRGLSLNQLGSYVSELFRRHDFTIEDYHFENKENYVDFRLRKDDEPWLVRVTVDEKVKQGVVLQMHQQMRSQPGTKVVFITSMDFQDQATRWAKDKPLVLIDGPTLLSMDD